MGEENLTSKKIYPYKRRREDARLLTKMCGVE